MVDVQEIYRARFLETGLNKRSEVWRILCREFFNPLIGAQKDVLDLACGYGEFINNVSARSKTAIDINPDAPKYLNSDVRFVMTPATDLAPIESNSLDIAFTSNFLEHLPNKECCDQVIGEILRVLRPGGRFVIMGPNIRYAYREYWDFYDHYLPLSHLSLEEGLKKGGFEVVRNVPRFLPYTMKSSLPTAGFLISAYLKMPFAWRFFGKQFLVVGQKPPR
ncbi:MAG TPA: class I SAM-dependent methyltransferase [Xanthobacteraceae bacterium]|nr:MAG: SAM-dependent methyltransferase [Rhizobiales bacterium 35-66-30]HQS09882.1 class I SAM-dependent methyltransferase [Xanthobacteraceae bacterium]